MARRPGSDRFDLTEECGEEVAKFRGATLTVALGGGVPAERHALNFLRDVVQREGYDYKALVKHVFLEGVRAYAASLAGSQVAVIDPIPTVLPLPTRRELGETAPARRRAPPKREPAPPPTQTDVPEPLPVQPPGTEVPRPNFAGLMGDGT